ncbi:MAG: ferrous iron transport protein B [Elusimicrobia bacterium]|nr:ferrous iron transport protein B [Elusimicrobiota bacterium]
MPDRQDSACDQDGKCLLRRSIILVGQPNVGKSALFNALTGRYVAVSNYPGTTVDFARGVGQAAGEAAEIVDSPGIGSLCALSDEEKVTQALVTGAPDVIVQVADAKNLGRHLALTLELSDLGTPLVLCLNMSDEALARGMSVDRQRLSQLLGIPVVETVAITREGIEELRNAIGQAKPGIKTDYPPEIARALSQLKTLLPEPRQGLAPLLLAGSDDAPGSGLDPEIHDAARTLRRRFVRPPARVMMESRQEQAARLAAEVLSQGPGHGSNPWLERIGIWTLRPWPGYLLACLALYGLYSFVGVFGAQIAVEFMEEWVFASYVNPAVTQAVRWLIPFPIAQELLVGPYGLFTMALTYAFALILPIVSTFFLALGLLEDSGYLPRLSVLLDRLFRLIGLNGKAVFPMILGLGCGTMAILTARILDTRKERLMVSFLLALAVPCSAQLGVILAMAAAASAWTAMVWLSVIIASLLATGALGSRLIPGSPAPFVLEIPPLRLPRPGNLGRKVWARLKWYLGEVVPLFVYATAILFVLDKLGWLEQVNRAMRPLVTGWLGLPEQSAQAFLLGFLRRDYGAAGFFQMQRQGLLSERQIAVAMVAITLFLPCVAQWLMTLKERGWKSALTIGGLVTAYALAVSSLLNAALLWLGWS